MKNVIYDLSAMIYSGALAGHSKNWCNTVGFPTGGLYKVLNQFFTDKKNGYNVIFVLDSRRDNTIRRQRYPQYKANRADAKTPLEKEKVGLQFEYINEIIDKLGIAKLQKETYEADDLIYSIVASFPNENFLIRADDSDLKDVMLINKNNQMKSVVGRGDIRNTGRSAIFNKICFGDISDNYPALSRQGQQVMNSLFSLDPNIIFGNYPSLELVTKLSKGSNDVVEEIARNIFLATPKLIKIDEIPVTNLNEVEMELILNALGCKSILKRGLGKERDYSSPKVKEEMIRLSSKISPELRQSLLSKNRKMDSSVIEDKEDNNSTSDMSWTTKDNSLDDIIKVLGGNV